MTTIAAVRDGKRTWIGSDTQGLSAETRIEVGPKWVRYRDWAMAIAGDRSAFNVCEYNAERLLKNLECPYEFTQRFYDLLADHHYDFSPSRDSAAPNCGQDTLLASSSGLWLILKSFSITPMERWTEGSGRAYGLGAMFAMREIKDAERVLRAGLAAGMEYDSGSGGEIWTDVLE